MRGVVFLGERKLELREFADPTPGPGEVVIAIKASGMCGSDLHPYRAAGNAAKALGLGGSGGPVIGGHEPCGVVAAVGPGVYGLDDDGYAAVAEIEVPASQEDEARRGARACPERIITIED